METIWKRVGEERPKEGEFYWCYPTYAKGGVYPLRYEGGVFSSGSYIPVEITHYKEIRIDRPKPPIFEDC